MPGGGTYHTERKFDFEVRNTQYSHNFGTRIHPDIATERAKPGIAVLCHADALCVCVFWGIMPCCVGQIVSHPRKTY